MELVLQWYELLIVIVFACSCGLLIASLLSSVSRSEDDSYNYWIQMSFMARSIMTEEQKEKLDKMMENKDEN